MIISCLPNICPYNYIHAYGRIYHQLGDLDESDEKYQEAAKIFYLLEDWSWYVYVLQGLAVNARIIGEYNKSLDFLKDGQYICLEKEFQGKEERKIGIAMNIALLHEQLDNLELCIQKFEQALFEDVNTIHEIDDIYDLFEMIRLHLNAGNPSRAKEFMIRLELLNSEHRHQDKVINNITKLGKALFLVRDNRIKPLAEAHEILTELLDYNFVSIEYNILVRNHLFNIKYIEFKASNIQELVNEMHGLIDSVINIVKGQYQYVLEIQSLILHSKLHFALDEITEANEVLEVAIRICKDNNLVALETQVSNVKQEMNDEILRIEANRKLFLKDEDFIKTYQLTEYLKEILKLKIKNKDN